MIYLFSGRKTKEAIERAIYWLKCKYEVDREVMDDPERIELMEIILDMECIIEHMEITK